MQMIYGNSESQKSTLNLLNSERQILCLSGDPHLGKSSFLREELPSIISESDLMFVDTSPDDARAARSFSISDPVESSFKVIVIERADFLSLAAQDAYLKLLEETPISLRVILTVSNEGHLQDAFRSRIREIIRWKPLNDEDMLSFASTIEPVDTFFLKISRGHPGLYSRMHGKSYYKDLYNFVVSSTSGLGHDYILQDIPQAFEKSSDLDDRSVISHICRYAALASSGTPDRIRSVLSFCSVLNSSSSASIPFHWSRVMSDFSSSL